MKELTDLGFASEPYNTNNGGGIGTMYTHPDGIIVKDGEACYRHAPSEKYITLAICGIRVLDLKPGLAARKRVVDAVRGYLNGELVLRGRDLIPNPEKN
jgi:hypothetical protein